MDTHNNFRLPALALTAAFFALTAGFIIGHGAVAGTSQSTLTAEPNDTLATATSTGLTGIGNATIEGVEIGDGDWGDLDVDIYSFELDEASVPALVTVEVEAVDSSLDAYVRLLESSGTELQNNDDRGLDNVDARLQTYLFAPGVLYIGVSASGNPYYNVTAAGTGMPRTTGPYTLTITIESASLPESPHEPNDELAAAVAMGNGSFSVSGEFVGDGPFGRHDVDVYKLALTGAARLDAQVRAESIGSPLDPVVQVLASPWESLGVSDDVPDGSVDPSLSVGVPEGLDLYILVYGAGNPKYRSPLVDWEEPGSVGPYELDVVVTYLDSAGVGEPDDSILTATYTNPLPHLRTPSAPNVFERFLGDGPYAQYRGDRDFYELRVLESGVVTIELATASIGSELDPILVAYDKSGRRIAVSTSSALDTNDLTLRMPVFCRAPNSDDEVSAYVMVMGTKQEFPDDPFVPWGEEPGQSSFRLEEFRVSDTAGSTGPYMLAMTWSPGEDSCASEPDDTVMTATDTGIIDEGFYLCTDGAIGDGECFDSYREVDMWSVQVDHAPAWLKVQVAACDGEENQLYLNHIRLFNPTGVEIAAADSPDYLASVPNTVVVLLESPGTYYVGVSDLYNDFYDPLVACAGPPRDPYPEAYQVLITLTQGTPGIGRVKSTGAAAGTYDPSSEPPLYVTRLDDKLHTIHVIHPDTRQTISFPAPEPRFSPAASLAFEGADLYYVGVGRYPKLYRLDPATGEVLETLRLWSGSGYYDGAVMFRGELFVLDYYSRAVHVLDPAAQQLLRTLPLRSTHGLTVSGGLAALANPDLLYVTDAFNTGVIYEFDALDGAISGQITPTTDRPTALASTGPSTLIVGDWESRNLEMLDRAGNPLGDLWLGLLPGALAGHPSSNVCPDMDWDGICDVNDNCPGQHNVAQTDSDEDGAGDECDLCVNDPDNDDDADGVCGDIDACPGFDDRLDQDADTIPDDCDNCTDLANTPQVDCNADGVGDVCAIAYCAPDDPACQDCNQNAVPDGCDLATRQTTQLMATEYTATETFGAAVASEGNLIAVVAPGDASDWRKPGSGYVFRLNPPDGNWIEEAKLAVSRPVLLEQLTDAIAVSGDRIVLVGEGRPYEGVSWPVVHVFHFKPEQEAWTVESRTMIPEGATTGTFSVSAAINAGTIVIGTPCSSENGPESGVAHVFSAGTPQQSTTLTAADAGANDRFGSSVAISDGLIVVGAPGADGSTSDSGAAYVFRYDPVSDTWEQEDKLMSPTLNTGDDFGSSVAFSGGTILIGAPLDDEYGTDAGAAYVFRYGTEAGQWNEKAKLTAGNSAEGDRFGHSVSLSRDTATVSGVNRDSATRHDGAVYAFRYSAALSAWEEIARLQPSDGAGNKTFGQSVSVSGTVAVVGAPSDAEKCPDEEDCERGSVYVYALPLYDCNANGVLDECDAGDANGDGRVDLSDYAQMHRCLTGPRPEGSSDLSLYDDPCCSIVDFDADGNVDLGDYARFVLRFGS